MSQNFVSGHFCFHLSSTVGSSVDDIGDGVGQGELPSLAAAAADDDDDDDDYSTVCSNVDKYFV